MHHTFKALGTIAAAMAVLGHASAKKFNSTELQALFSNTTVKFTTKRAKVTLWLMSDDKARSHAVLAQRANKQHGIWWIKEPNIHCLKWSQRKKNICRPVGSVEKSGEGYSAKVRGLTWTITKIKEKVAVDPSNIEKVQEQEAEIITQQLPISKGPMSIRTVVNSGATLFWVIRWDKKANEVDSSKLLAKLKSVFTQGGCAKAESILKPGGKYVYVIVGSAGNRIGDLKLGKADCGF